jgi:hypothetical protein
MEIFNSRIAWAATKKDPTLLVITNLKLPDDPQTYSAFDLFDRCTGKLRLKTYFRVTDYPGLDYSKEGVPMPVDVVAAVEAAARTTAEQYKASRGPGIPRGK